MTPHSITPAAGQVKLELSHHNRVDGGAFESSKPLVFLMDELKVKEEVESKKKKKKTAEKVA